MAQLKPKGNEKQLQNAILEWISLHPRFGFAFPIYNGAVYSRKRDCYLKPGKWHIHGISDICGIWIKRPLFIETKWSTTVTEAQAQFLKVSQGHNAIAFVTRDIRHAIKTLADLAGIVS